MMRTRMTIAVVGVLIVLMPVAIFGLLKAAESGAPPYQQYFLQKLWQTDSIIPDPNYLKNAPRPVVFREYVHKYLKEPLSSDELKFLEEKLRKAKDDDVRIQCALLLYRYGVAAGEDYLVSRLEGPDNLRAATALALGREEQYLPQILEIASTPTGFSEFEVRGNKIPLVRALSRWDAPGIGEVIFELSKRSLTLTVYFASALAYQGVVEAEPDIRRTLIQASSSSSSAVSHYHAALYMLTGEISHVIEIGDLLSASLEQLKSADMDDRLLSESVERCWHAMEALSSLQLPEASHWLQDAIVELQSISKTLTADRMPDLMRMALLSLARSEADISSASIRVLVSGLAGLPEDQNIRLGIALEIGAETVENHPELVREIGQSTIVTSRALEALKPIPPYFVPDTSLAMLSSRYRY